MVLRPTVLCTCNPKCHCGKKLDDVNEVAEKDKLSIFLIGLHDRYTGARNQIMLMRPLPDVCEAYSMIAQQERQFLMNTTGFGSQLHQAGESGATGSVFLASADSGGQYYKKYSTGNKKPVCTHCGYTGHTQDKCYKKHGYPPGWKPRSRNQGSVNQTQGPMAVHQSQTEAGLSFTHEDFKKFLEFVQLQKAPGGGTLNTPIDQPLAQVNTISAVQMPGAQLEGCYPWQDDWSG